MKQTRFVKTLIAYLLLAVFMLPHLAKEIHTITYEWDEACCSHSDDTHHAKHDCNSCAICQFTFSLFTEVDSVTTSNISEILFATLDIIDKDEKYNSTTVSLHLRAPPLHYTLSI